MREDFQRLADSGKLFHSYLLFGSPDADFVRGFASYLEQGAWEQGPAPLIDFHISGTGIDDIRSAIAFLWQKPLRASRKTLVIPNGESLTREAQNAILKIAEEPPPHALIFLLARNPGALLPTLCSRFQKVYAAETQKNGVGDTKLAEDFLRANITARKELLKAICEDSRKVEEFVTVMIDVLRRDAVKNWRPLRQLLRRWALINQYNTNKRLQLEAALLHI